MDADFETTKLSPVQATPHHDRGRVPPGGIVCHPRWKGTDAAKAMQGTLCTVIMIPLVLCNLAVSCAN